MGNDLEMSLWAHAMMGLSFIPEPGGSTEHWGSEGMWLDLEVSRFETGTALFSPFSPFLTIPDQAPLGILELQQGWRTAEPEGGEGRKKCKDWQPVQDQTSVCASYCCCISSSY